MPRGCRITFSPSHPKRPNAVDPGHPPTNIEGKSVQCPITAATCRLSEQAGNSGPPIHVTREQAHCCPAPTVRSQSRLVGVGPGELSGLLCHLSWEACSEGCCGLEDLKLDMVTHIIYTVNLPMLSVHFDAAHEQKPAKAVHWKQ